MYDVIAAEDLDEVGRDLPLSGRELFCRDGSTQPGMVPRWISGQATRDIGQIDFASAQMMSAWSCGHSSRILQGFLRSPTIGAEGTLFVVGNPCPEIIDSEGPMERSEFNRKDWILGSLMSGHRCLQLRHIDSSLGGEGADVLEGVSRAV